MIKIIVAPFETYLENRDEFVSFDHPIELQMEHSLRTISDWEAKWHKPYLITNTFGQDPHTEEEVLDYIKCMIINDAPKDAIYGLTQAQLIEIKGYIDNPMTATTIKHGAANNKPVKRTGEIITSELIYYWMTACQIPFDCDKWHLNRLLTLIEVCNVKNNPDKKMSNNDVLKANRQLNAARRAKHHTKG